MKIIKKILLVIVLVIGVLVIRFLVIGVFYTNFLKPCSSFDPENCPPDRCFLNIPTTDLGNGIFVHGYRECIIKK